MHLMSRTSGVVVLPRSCQSQTLHDSRTGSNECQAPLRSGRWACRHSSQPSQLRARRLLRFKGRVRCRVGWLNRSARKMLCVSAGNSVGNKENVCWTSQRETGARTRWIARLSPIYKLSPLGKAFRQPKVSFNCKQLQQDVGPQESFCTYRG